MPAYFDTGFFVKDPFWHQLGTVLDEYPGRVEGMELAGHDFNVIRRPLFLGGMRRLKVARTTAQNRDPQCRVRTRAIEGWNALVRVDDRRHSARRQGLLLDHSELGRLGHYRRARRRGRQIRDRHHPQGWRCLLGPGLARRADPGPG